MSSFPPGLVLIGGAALLLLAPRSVRPWGFLLFPAIAFGLLLSMDPGDELTVAFLDYRLVLTSVDKLSLAFGYVFTIIAFLAGIYALHMKERGQQVTGLLYAGSALGVVFAGDLFTLVVYWEVLALSSVYLIWARGTPKAKAAGLRYLFVHLTGGAVLVGGVVWHVGETGSILFNHMESSPTTYMILFSFALNAAVVPLHAWLPDSYPEATVTGSVLLSAFTTKTAVYVLARGFAGWELLMWAGAAMAVYGVVYAVLENDIRRILAYHIVSQVGYMVCAVGIGTEMAINGAAAHAFAHILYKGLLFMGAGAVLYAVGRSKLSELGGLARAMPVALAAYMVAALSISAFPLFSGFVSKSLVIHAAEMAHQDTIVLLLYLASIGTFLSVGLKLPYLTWFGPQRALTARRLPWGMIVAMLLAAGLNVAIGVYPSPFFEIMPFEVDYEPYTTSHVVQSLQLLIFTGFGFWLLLSRLHGDPKLTLDTDWLYRRALRQVEALTLTPLRSVFTTAERLTNGVTGLASRAVMQPETSWPGPSMAKGGADRAVQWLRRPPVGIAVAAVLVTLVIVVLLGLAQ